ncbi:MAG: flavodoxin-dependent (E)-4-hydroxy-3-methylbut-2-enyl-diphosphate synthase [Clostridia bacterium]|nr:flavodoxin-dependent (E)-4-hydroxy-3-methylbut-2-enyl-diphosphate synthase [Clostridia bacterium]
MKYNDIRRRTHAVTVGGVGIGGAYRLPIQSMTNTDTHDREATLAQVRALAAAGCDIVRLAVPDLDAVPTIGYLKEALPEVPLVADIHFDYRIALACAEQGVDKIRINPGNIGDAERVRAVCRACAARKIPIRIGVNSGSLEKSILAKHGAPTAEALCESAMYHAGLLEQNDFTDIVISIKASNVPQMIAANRLVAEACPYPLHLGVTEAGSETMGMVKSAAGIGALLCDGIGDTLRVSLTADPIREIGAARKILAAVDMEGQRGLDMICCPTCGRTKIDLIPLVERFERAVEAEGLGGLEAKVALMGCVVNGPGEAREADVGIAGGIGEAVLFRRGEIVERIPEDAVIERLIAELKAMRDRT